MEVGGALTTWLVPLVCVLGIIGIEWKWKYPHFHIVDFFKADPFNQGLVLLCFVIIVIPLGWWIALPAGAIGMGIRAIASEDSQNMWPTRWQARSAMVVALLLGAFFTGFGSVSKPIGVEEWGPVIRDENPDAPNWPASEQHIWRQIFVDIDGLLDSEITILVVNHVRLPGTISPIGSGSMALWHLENSETDEIRLKQAIEELPGSGFKSDWFSLETIAYGQTHDYSGQILPYTIKNVNMGDQKIAEMVTVALSTWGGEIKLLTVIKPFTSEPPFYNDPYASLHVEPWLDANA